MPPRQMWVFTFGCWVALAAAAIHVVGHLVVPLSPSTEEGRQLMAHASAYRFAFPGGVERTLMNLVDGFSLSYAVLLAAMGGLGLAVARRGGGDELLMASVARVSALAGVALLGLSLSYFFIAPALVIALMTVCYVLASVRR